MAADEVSNCDEHSKQKLSHKQWRALLKKERRKLKRQAEAKSIESLEKNEEENVSISTAQVLIQNAQEERLARLEEEAYIREAAQRHAVWLEREAQAQQEYAAAQERLRQAQICREEDEKKIKEEWMETQKKEAEEKEIKKKEEEIRKSKQVTTTGRGFSASDIELSPHPLVTMQLYPMLLWQYALLLWIHVLNFDDRLQEALLKKATSHEKRDPSSWHNPLAPVNYGTEDTRNQCPFFTKVAACRFGDQCSRTHVRPERSRILLFPGMFQHFKLAQGPQDETDVDLEYDEGEVYDQFRSFYDDILSEFCTVGQVIQLKVCCNYEPHLRGNVYVQYHSDEETEAAYALFNGRWYGGKQLSCEFCLINKWKLAICGLFFRRKCPKGKSCNFMHVFQNPRNEFWKMDKDIDPSQNSQRESSRRSYPRKFDRSSRRHHRSRSRSPSRRRSRSRSPRRKLSRSPSRRRSRSRSPQRKRLRSPNGHRTRSRSPRRRSRLPTSERSRSRSPNRKRSRSPSKRRSRSRSPIRKRSRSPSKRRSRSRSPNMKRSRSTSKRRSRSRSPLRKRSRSPSKRRSRSRSPLRKKSMSPGRWRSRSRSPITKVASSARRSRSTSFSRSRSRSRSLNRSQALRRSSPRGEANEMGLSSIQGGQKVMPDSTPRNMVCYSPVRSLSRETSPSGLPSPGDPATSFGPEKPPIVTSPFGQTDNKEENIASNQEVIAESSPSKSLTDRDVYVDSIPSTGNGIITNGGEDAEPSKLPEKRTSTNLSERPRSRSRSPHSVSRSPERKHHKKSKKHKKHKKKHKTSKAEGENEGEHESELGAVEED